MPAPQKKPAPAEDPQHAAARKWAEGKTEEEIEQHKIEVFGIPKGEKTNPNWGSSYRYNKESKRRRRQSR